MRSSRSVPDQWSCERTKRGRGAMMRSFSRQNRTIVPPSDNKIPSRAYDTRACLLAHSPRNLLRRDKNMV